MSVDDCGRGVMRAVILSLSFLSLFVIIYFLKNECIVLMEAFSLGVDDSSSTWIVLQYFFVWFVALRCLLGIFLKRGLSARIAYFLSGSAPPSSNKRTDFTYPNRAHIRRGVLNPSGAVFLKSVRAFAAPTSGCTEFAFGSACRESRKFTSLTMTRSRD